MRSSLEERNEPDSAPTPEISDQLAHQVDCGGFSPHHSGRSGQNLVAGTHGHESPRATSLQTSDSAAQKSQITTLNDQTDLNVTVYNSNIALVRDVRELTLPTGNFRLKFEDIAATVNPATVHFRSLTDPEKLSVLEQNYEYDLLEPAKLLHKYVGKEVTLVRTTAKTARPNTKKSKPRCSPTTTGQVWKIGNDIVTGGYARATVSPKSPRISTIIRRC